MLYTYGEMERYNNWLLKIKRIVKKYKISKQQTINILENINEFKELSTAEELEKFINIFFVEKKIQYFSIILCFTLGGLFGYFLSLMIHKIF